MNYKKLYNELILDRANILILNYKIKNGKYSYRFKHHALDANTTQMLTDLLVDNMVFYAYGEDEINSKFNFDPANLHNKAAFAVSERLAKRQDFQRDGLIGEIMLDLLIQKLNQEAQKIFTRAKHTRQGDNNEITGYDSAYFLKNDNGLELWLGQAKAGGDYYCQKGIADDLNSKYLDKYFCDSIRYMVDRFDNVPKDPTLLSIIKEVNAAIQDSIALGLTGNERKTTVQDNIFAILIKHSVTIVIPCLLMPITNIYTDKNKFKDLLEEYCEKIFQHFEVKTFSMASKINVKILFITLPTNELNEIKKSLIEIKKGYQ